MNISEFERLKPTKTYKAITELLSEVENLIQKDAEYQTYNYNLFSIKYKLQEIKELFLKGE